MRIAKIIKGVCILGLVFGAAAPKQPTKQTIELETLRIKGNIYEPQVLYILEQPSIDLITTEEKKRHDFLDGINKTLMERLY